MKYKIKTRSISWKETRRLAKIERENPKNNLFKSAVIVSVIVAVFVVVILFIISAIKGNYNLGMSYVYFAGVIALVSFVFSMLAGYFGRKIILAKEDIKIMSVGSDRPYFITYSAIDRCEIRSITKLEQPMFVMDIFREPKVMDTVEIPYDKDSAPMVRFLEDKGVNVVVHSAPKKFA